MSSRIVTFNGKVYEVEDDAEGRQQYILSGQAQKDSRTQEPIPFDDPAATMAACETNARLYVEGHDGNPDEDIPPYDGLGQDFADWSLIDRIEGVGVCVPLYARTDAVTVLESTGVGRRRRVGRGGR